MKNIDPDSVLDASHEQPLDGSPRFEATHVLLAALDAASEAIVVVDAALGVVYDNRAARRAFLPDACVAMQGRQLAIACPADRAALQAAVAAAIDADKVTALRMHDRKGAMLAFCRVLPLARDDAAKDRLALIVSRSSQVEPEQIRVVCDISGLSQAECRVAELLAGGANPQEIARAIGCSIHTVRAHLKQIFYKTNTARQAEFIALVRTAVP